MAGEHPEIDAKRLGYFAAAVLAAALVVTAVYWAFFGMTRWTKNIQQGANLMMAAATVPSQGQKFAGVGSAGQFVCPRDGAVGLPVMDAAGVPRCPVCNQVMCFNAAQAPFNAPAAAPLGLAALGGG